MAKPGYGIKTDGGVVRCVRGCGGSCDPKDVSVCTGCPDGFELS